MSKIIKRFVAIVCAIAGLHVLADDLQDALNCQDLTFTSGGDSGWVVDTQQSHDGVSSLKSGVIADSKKSYVETMVEAGDDDSVSFWWKVSSEINADYLTFYVDDVATNKISGVTEWSQIVCKLTAGTHKLRWEYKKDGTQSENADCGWLDQVVWSRNQQKEIAGIKYWYKLQTDGTCAVSNVVPSASVTKLAITNEFAGYPATELLAKSFVACSNVIELTIPDSIKTIRQGAFYGCGSIEKMTLPFVGETRTSTSETSASETDGRVCSPN